VPRDVEVSAIETATSAWMAPESPNSQVSSSAAARQASQVHQARRPPAPGQLVKLDLVAGEQEQQTQAQLAQQVDRLGRLRPSEHVRPDQDTEHEQQHDFGHELAWYQTRDQGRQHTAQHDPEERRGG